MAFKTQKGYCTRKEAAQILNVSVRTIENYTSRGILKNYAPITGEGRQEIRLQTKDVEALVPHTEEIASIEERILEYKRRIQEEQKELLEDYRSLPGIGIFKDAFYYDMPGILESMFEFCDPLRDRDKDILTAVLKGENMNAITSYYKISRERVRQLINRASRIVHEKCLPNCAEKYKSMIEENKMLKKENEMLRKTYQENYDKLSQYISINNLIKQLDDPECSVKGNLDTVKILLTPLDQFSFSTRTRGILRAAHICNVANLVSYPRKEISRFRSMGQKSLAELDDFLAARNLSFGMELSDYGFVYAGDMWEPTKGLLNIINQQS